jgi:hypothetical protein
MKFVDDEFSDVDYVEGEVKGNFYINGFSDNSKISFSSFSGEDGKINLNFIDEKEFKNKEIEEAYGNINLSYNDTTKLRDFITDFWHYFDPKRMLAETNELLIRSIFRKPNRKVKDSTSCKIDGYGFDSEMYFVKHSECKLISNIGFGVQDGKIVLIVFNEGENDISELLKELKVSVINPYTLDNFIDEVRVRNKMFENK